MVNVAPAAVLPTSNVMPGPVMPRAAIVPALVFDPRTLGNLALWLDARYPNGFGGSIPADGSALGQWNDLSGNGRHATQGVAASKPLYRSANPNLLTYNQATVETDTTGFCNQNNASLARVTSQALQGAASLQVTSVASVSTVWSPSTGVSTPCAGASPGVTYTAVVSSKAATASRSVQVTIYWLNNANSVISSSGGTATANSTSAWTQHTVTATAPALTAGALMAVTTMGTAASEVHYFDQIGLWEGSSTTWLPPVTLPAGMPVVQFDGADDGFSFTSPVWNPAATTIYAVAQSYDPTTGGAVVGVAGGVAAYLGNVAGAADGRVTGTFTSNPYSALKWTTGTRVVSWVLSASASTLTIDGTTPGGSATASAASGVTGTNGYVSTASLPWEGHIAAVLIYPAAHDTATRQRIERALGRIYGVTVA